MTEDKLAGMACCNECHHWWELKKALVVWIEKGDDRRNGK